jgi:hypothetical protein
MLKGFAEMKGVEEVERISDFANRVPLLL